MSIFKDFITKQEQDFYLRSTTYLMQIPSKKFRDELSNLYNSADLQMMTIATVLNAIYTDGKPTFFLSYRSMVTIIENDKNLTYKSRQGIKTTQYSQAYKLMRDYFETSTAFDLICNSSQDNKSPMCIALVDEDLLLSMGDQMMIKLASNWHQMAIKTVQVLNTKDKSDKSLHVSDLNTNLSMLTEKKESDVLNKKEEEFKKSLELIPISWKRDNLPREDIGFFMNLPLSVQLHIFKSPTPRDELKKLQHVTEGSL